MTGVHASSRTQRFSKLCRAGLLLGCVAVAGLAAAAAPAGAADVDRDGYHDALVRGRSNIGYANVGSACETRSLSTGAVLARLTVRPPRVWGLLAYGRHNVSWRAIFYDARTNVVVARGAWVGAVVDGRQWTVFGGGPDAPQTMIGYRNYWQGSQFWQHLSTDGVQLAANVQVGWQHPSTGRWYNVTMPVVDTSVSILGNPMAQRNVTC